MNFLGKMNEKDALNVNSLVLAYIGDAVHSLAVREKLVHDHDCKAGELHKMASDRVNAHTQACLAEKVWDSLTETERAVYLRGRNGKSHHTAKNQSRTDYRKATGIEAVLGFLYLTGDIDRIICLLEDDAQ